MAAVEHLFASHGCRDPNRRALRYTVPIVSQVRGRVIEVPIEEGNVPVKKGEVLFRIDPTPYQLQVNTLQAQLANAVAQQRELQESLKGA
ncbi:MAG: biotin/lipoyl-binding protein, partial [Betaproteobacteria bacterium]